MKDIQILLELVKRTVKAKDQLTNMGDYCENLLYWSLRCRSYVSPEVAFNLENHKYLVGLYACTSSKIVVKKAGQVGVSEWAVSKAFHACDLRKSNVLYIMPTTGDVSDFSRMRFAPAIQASSHLSAIMSTTIGTDKVDLKRVRSNFIIFRGGQVGSEGSARQLKSIPVDLVIRDEVDEMDNRVAEIADKRLGHSLIKETVAISTPSYSGVGIDKEWQLSDQREWFIPCPHCGTWQDTNIDMCVIEWDDLKRPVAWHGMKENRAWLACKKCGLELDRLAMGRWVARHPDREVAGFHPTKLFTKQTEVIHVVKGLKKTNENDRKEVFNQDLGEAYKPKGGSLTNSDLDACLRDYLHGRIDTKLPAVMGVDVGALLHVVIRLYPDENGFRRQLYAGEVAGPDDLVKLMDRYNVRLCVIDALPETRMVRDFQASRPRGRVWACYYGTDSKQTSPVQWHSKGTQWYVNADRTWSLDETFDRFYQEVNTLPANGRTLTNYYDQLKAPVRKLVTTGSGSVVRYVESGADHFTHAENYCTIASMKPLPWARG